MFNKFLHIIVFSILFIGIVNSQTVTKSQTNFDFNNVHFDSIAISHFVENADGFKVYAELQKFASINQAGKRTRHKAKGLGWLELKTDLSTGDSDFVIYKKSPAPTLGGSSVLSKLSSLSAKANKSDLYENMSFRKELRNNVVAKYEDMIETKVSDQVGTYPELGENARYTYPFPMYSNQVKYTGARVKPESFVQRSMNDEFTVKGEASEVPIERYSQDTKDKFWARETKQVFNNLDGSVNIHNKLIDKKRDKKAPFEERIEFVTFDKSAQETFREEYVFDQPYDFQESYKHKISSDKYNLIFVTDEVFVYNGNPSKKFPDLKKTDLRIFYRAHNGEIIFDQKLRLQNEKSRVVHAFMNDNKANIVVHSWKADEIETYMIDKSGLINQSTFAKGSSVYDTYISYLKDRDKNLKLMEESILSDGSKIQCYKNVLTITDLKTKETYKKTKLYLFKLDKNGELTGAKVLNDNKSEGIKYDANARFINEEDGKLNLAYERMDNRKEISDKMLAESLGVLQLDANDLSGDLLSDINIRLFSFSSYFINDDTVYVLGFDQVKAKSADRMLSKETVFKIEF